MIGILSSFLFYTTPLFAREPSACADGQQRLQGDGHAQEYLSGSCASGRFVCAPVGELARLISAKLLVTPILEGPLAQSYADGSAFRSTTDAMAFLLSRTPDSKPSDESAYAVRCTDPNLQLHHLQFAAIPVLGLSGDATFAKPLRAWLSRDSDVINAESQLVMEVIRSLFWMGARDSAVDIARYAALRPDDTRVTVWAASVLAAWKSPAGLAMCKKVFSEPNSEKPRAACGQYFASLGREDLVPFIVRNSAELTVEGDQFLGMFRSPVARADLTRRRAGAKRTSTLVGLFGHGDQAAVSELKQQRALNGRAGGASLDFIYMPPASTAPRAQAAALIKSYASRESRDEGLASALVARAALGDGSAIPQIVKELKSPETVLRHELVSLLGAAFGQSAYHPQLLLRDAGLEAALLAYIRNEAAASDRAEAIVALMNVRAGRK